MTTENNLDRIDEDSAYLLGRGEHFTNAGTTESLFRATPGLVGYWPMTSVERTSGSAYDFGPQARDLTRTGTPDYPTTTQGASYINLNGSTDFLSRPDESALQITGLETVFPTANRGLTLCCWIYPNAITPTKGLMFKTASYELFAETGGNILWRIHGPGGLNDVRVSFVAGAWQFIAARFDPSTETKVWNYNLVSKNSTSNTTSIEASINTSVNAFHVGGPVPFNGRISNAMLCANALTDWYITGKLFEFSRGLYA